MTAVRVFDPAMCCSTGVCGPSVDPRLAHLAADLTWLKSQGVAVERFNLAQQPGAFAEDSDVRSALDTKGDAGLPIIKVNGEMKSSGVYPTRAELADWAEVGRPTSATGTSTPIKLKAVSTSCCTPAAGEPGETRGPVKSGSCC